MKQLPSDADDGRPSATLCGAKKRRNRCPAVPAKQIPEKARQRMEKVARYVVLEDGGPQSEAIFKKLLSITGDEDRWGFISPNHPHHAYYRRRKAAARRLRHAKPRA